MTRLSTMATEAGELLSSYLSRLPTDHKDRPFLDTLRQRILAYQAAEHRGRPTPESCHALWQTLWREWGSSLGRSIHVPEPRLRDDAFELLKRRNRTLVYVP